MNYPDGLIAKAKTAASAAELPEMAKECNITLTEEEATEYFDFLNGNRKFNKDGLQELSNVELQMVAGGKGGGDSEVTYGKYHFTGHVGQYSLIIGRKYYFTCDVNKSDWDSSHQWIYGAVIASYEEGNQSVLLLIECIISQVKSKAITTVNGKIASNGIFLARIIQPIHRCLNHKLLKATGITFCGQKGRCRILSSEKVIQ